MLTIKLIEVRDNGTCIPCAAFRAGGGATLTPHENWLLGHAGFGREFSSARQHVYLVPLANPKRTHYDPFQNGTSPRTLFTAHQWLVSQDENAWPEVLDVRTILGETEAPCKSDMHFVPPAFDCEEC